MATFDMNKRGGLTVDRDSLHASDGYRRQVEALKQLRERTMNADVEKAVEASADFEPCGGCGNADPDQRCLGCLHQFNPITAHLGAEHGTDR